MVPSPSASMDQITSKKDSLSTFNISAKSSSPFKAAMHSANANVAAAITVAAVKNLPQVCFQCQSVGVLFLGLLILLSYLFVLLGDFFDARNY